MSSISTIDYFGYASNLDEDTLLGKVRSCRLKGLAALKEYGFRFDFLNPDGSARANILRSSNETVYGVLYEIDVAEIQDFIVSEPGYNWVAKNVLHGGQEVKAMTFIADQHIPNIYPHADYLELILNGGRKNRLPETYLSLILNRAGRMLY